MFNRAWLPTVAAAGLIFVTAFTAACGSNNPKPQVPAPPPPPVAQAPVVTPKAPAPDPITVLIDASQQHFLAGERELKLGHLEQARTEFDRAVELLLESPYGARSDARLREHFDRLVDRINAYEVTALAQGDGFSEKASEPASIDALLTIATFPKPAPGAATEKDRQGGPRGHRTRRADPAKRSGAGLRRTLPGPASRLHPGEPDARHEVPADDPGSVSRRGSAARSRPTSR